MVYNRWNLESLLDTLRKNLYNIAERQPEKLVKYHALLDLYNTLKREYEKNFQC
jgi:hypothetical protein